MKSDIHRTLKDCQSIHEASIVLKLLIEDFETSIHIQEHFLELYVRENYEERYDPGILLRFSFNQILLNCSRFLEFYERYKSILSFEDNKPKLIFNKLKELNIRKYRNNNIAHIMKFNNEDDNDCIDKIDKEFKSIQAFCMRLNSYPFINKPLIDELKAIKNHLFQEKAKINQQVLKLMD